jgi:hypothetical protein
MKLATPPLECVVDLTGSTLARAKPLLLLALLVLTAAARFIATTRSLGAPSIATPERAHRAPALIAESTPGPHESARSTCWISGDLVGDANPASMGAVLCDH